LDLDGADVTGATSLLGARKPALIGGCREAGEGVAVLAVVGGDRVDR